MMEDEKRFISSLMIAVSHASLYSKGHASVKENASKLHAIMDKVFSAGSEYEVMVIGDDIVINGSSIKRAGDHGSGLVKTFKKKGISRVDFLKGIGIPEIVSFIEDLAGKDSAIGYYPNIRTGIVDVMFSVPSGSEYAMGDDNMRAFGSRQVEQVREVFYDIPRFKKLNVIGIEEVVLQFIAAFRREASILRLLNPIRSYSEYTYTHATNVAILTMLQAERLGLEDEMLRSVGIAALLHDAGKMFISNDILEKKGALSAHEWEEMQRHTVYGAKYLSKIENLSPIAALVALEHHGKFDGSGYPKTAIGKKQILVSQMVAISDTFDAMRSKRPYKKDWGPEETLALLKKCSGKDFNPFLVGHFVEIVKKGIKEEGCEA